jgi:hypothetical protein
VKKEKFYKNKTIFLIMTNKNDLLEKIGIGVFLAGASGVAMYSLLYFGKMEKSNTAKYTERMFRGFETELTQPTNKFKNLDISWTFPNPSTENNCKFNNSANSKDSFYKNSMCELSNSQ